MTVEPKPWKRFCPQSHDTWVCGRSGQSHTCRNCQRQRSRLAEAEKRNAVPTPEYVPNLHLLRKQRGFTVEEVAFETTLTVDEYRALEDCNVKATYSERVNIYQAITVLTNRQEERVQREAEKRRRLVKAGLGSL